MKVRNLFFGFVLAMMILGVGSFTPTTAQIHSCNQGCTLSVYRPCMAECAPNDVACQDECQRQYECCYSLCLDPFYGCTGQPSNLK